MDSLNRNCKPKKVRPTFHGKEFPSLLLSHEEDFSNITPAKQLDLLKARWTYFNLDRK